MEKGTTDIISVGVFNEKIGGSLQIFICLTSVDGLIGVNISDSTLKDTNRFGQLLDKNKTKTSQNLWFLNQFDYVSVIDYKSYRFKCKSIANEETFLPAVFEISLIGESIFIGPKEDVVIKEGETKSISVLEGLMMKNMGGGHEIHMDGNDVCFASILCLQGEVVGNHAFNLHSKEKRLMPFGPQQLLIKVNDVGWNGNSISFTVQLITETKEIKYSN